MGIEIERKFLLRNSDWRSAIEKSTRMLQGYLGGERCSVRVRIEGEAAFLNIKTKVIGIAREEFEYAIPLQDAEQQLSLYCPQRVEKIRHLVTYASLLWEIDEFLGESAGLIVAEVELASEDQQIEKPPWLGEEVSVQKRFYNIALATMPFSQWSDKSNFEVKE